MIPAALPFFPVPVTTPGAGALPVCININSAPVTPAATRTMRVDGFPKAYGRAAAAPHTLCPAIVSMLSVT